MRSNQESIRTGPKPIHAGTVPPKLRAYAITKARNRVRKRRGFVAHLELCNKITHGTRPGTARNCQGLLERTKEFQAKEAHLARRVLSQDLRYDRRSFARNKTGRGGRWGGNGQVNSLVGPKNVRRGNAGAGGADIEGLGQLDELGTRDIGSSEKNGHLQADAWRTSS